MRKVDPQIGERVPVIGNYSEVMVYMKLAEKPIEVALQPNRMVQIYVDGNPFSAPVTCGEGGFYCEKDENGEDRYYTYARD